jgi:hypothetical protein
VVRYWWWHLGSPCYPDARELLIAADLAGTRGKTNQFWKLALQHLADETHLKITVSYLPPGTIRWARIDQTLHASTETEAGGERRRTNLVLRSVGTRSSDAGTVLRPEFAKDSQRSGLQAVKAAAHPLLLDPATFHGDWNYTICAHPDGTERPAKAQTAS